MAVWLMLEGTAPGVGKTTLAHALAAAFSSRGMTVDLLDEDAFFDRPETTVAATAFRTRRTAGEEELLAGYAALAAAQVDAIIFTWSCAAMAEDLVWAAAEGKLALHAARVLDLVRRRLEPIALFLEASIDVAFERAAAQRGMRWLEQQAGSRAPGLAEAHPLDEASLLDEARRRHRRRATAAAERNRRALTDGGWPLVRLDSTGPRGQVLADALDALQNLGLIDAQQPSGDRGRSGG